MNARRFGRGGILAQGEGGRLPVEPAPPPRPERRDTSPSALARMTEHELRAAVNEFTEDDPPPYAGQ